MWHEVNCSFQVSTTQDTTAFRAVASFFVTGGGGHYRECPRLVKALYGGLVVSSPRKFSNLEAPQRYFQHFSRDMSPKNRPRISVKRQMFSVLTSDYIRGPVK